MINSSRIALVRVLGKEGNLDYWYFMLEQSSQYSFALFLFQYLKSNSPNCLSKISFHFRPEKLAATNINPLVGIFFSEFSSPVSLEGIDFVKRKYFSVTPKSGRVQQPNWATKEIAFCDVENYLRSTLQPQNVTYLSFKTTWVDVTSWNILLLT